MSTTIDKMSDLIDSAIDNARQAGVRRGINASVEALEELKAEYIRIGQPMAAGVINTALVKLLALNIEEVEG